MTKHKQVALLLLVGLLVPLQQSANGQQTHRPRLANTLCDYDSDNDYVCATDLILARTTRNPAAAYGDSGGPVFALDGSRVRAVGTITGSVGANLYFQDFGTAWRDFGITPMTST